MIEEQRKFHAAKEAAKTARKQSEAAYESFINKCPLKKGDKATLVVGGSIRFANVDYPTTSRYVQKHMDCRVTSVDEADQPGFTWACAISSLHGHVWRLLLREDGTGEFG